MEASTLIFRSQILAREYYQRRAELVPYYGLVSEMRTLTDDETWATAVNRLA